MKRILAIIFTLSFFSLQAQENAGMAKLYVAGFTDNGKILLRWSPDNSIDWQRGNKAGYSVYRRAVMRDGKVINNPDSIFLGSFAPLPLDKWEPFADSSHFAVAAEAIYGKGFELTTQSNNFFDMVNKSREQDSRFSMGLLCADQSFSVACMMGLGLVDSAVNANEVYLYIVVANAANSKGIKCKGYGVVDFKAGNFLPRPFGINHQVIQSMVTIMVPYATFKGIYTNFELQKSEDNKNFHTVKDKSFYSMSTTSDDPEFSIYTDSVRYQASTVYYRLRGKTPFDAYGPFSDTISIKIMPSLSGEPWITDIKELGNGKLVVSWETPEYKQENLKGFMLYSSKKYEGPYLDVYKTPIEKSARFTAVDAPSGYAYLRIGALDQFGRPYFSIPRLYQAIDSIPPSAPKGLAGLFDSTGVASFKWNYGKEPDLLCYQLLYSANAQSEYSLVTKGFIYDSTFTAKFPVNMLSSDLFFKVVALDTRYNTSKASESIKLIKPDTISPSAPVIFVNYDSTGLARVALSPSLSNDIKLHHLFFESEGGIASKNELFKGVVKGDTSIALPMSIGKGKIYCVAEDITHRKSISNSISVNISANNKSSEQEAFKAIAKPLVDEGAIQLIWDARVIKGDVMIYRKDDVTPYSLIATVDSQKMTYSDRNVTINTNYSYKLVCFNRSGKMISKVVTVKYR